ncbi:DNA-binding protein [Eggerthellaceae bacterium zg-893]|nr:DNA-binding protein [Eggerthellaceae bacterium zg-893]
MYWEDLPVASELIEGAGLPRKAAYTLNELSEATGAQYEVLSSEVRKGRLPAFLPRGRKRGRLVRPAWLEKWYRDGMTVPVD